MFYFIIFVYKVFSLLCSGISGQNKIKNFHCSGEHALVTGHMTINALNLYLICKSNPNNKLIKQLPGLLRHPLPLETMLKTFL